MLDTDPPPHTRMRGLVNKGFTPRVINTYEERIRGLARGILATAFERDEFDWVESVAAEIPMWVFSEIMGLPVEDRRLIIELGDKILGNTDPDVVGEEYVVERALRDPKLRMLPFSSPFSLDLIEYGRGLGEARRRRAAGRHHDEARRGGDRGLAAHRAGVRDDVHPADDGRERDDAAHDQPRPRRPARRTPTSSGRLVDDPSLAGAAADELLRRAHPVHHFRRTATRDVEIHGRTIRRGDKVTVWYAGANYDEEKFADPYRLDVGRDAEPPRHVRPRRAALLPRRAPRQARDQGLARGDDPVPPAARAGRRAGAATLELLQRHQAHARAGDGMTEITRSERMTTERPGGGRARPGRAGRAGRAPALHRPARRRARQGHPAPALRRPLRGGSELLRRRDGHRPAAHARRGRRDRVRRLRRPAGPHDRPARAVDAGGRLVPRRGVDARRLRPLAVVPPGAPPSA